MRKNIIFTLFGIIGFMMTPVGADAARCSYATNAPYSTSSTGTHGRWMIVLGADCSDNKIFYCDGNTDGAFFYGSVSQRYNTSPFQVTPNGEKSLLRCDGKYWVPVSQDNRSCCNDCSPINFTTNTCSCRVYISEGYGWSLKKCGGRDIPSHWRYKECCNKISSTDYTKNGKRVYLCDDESDDPYWTYEKCGGQSCDSVICTDATISGTVDVLPWNNRSVTQQIRNKIVYYNDDCSQAGSYYECSRNKNYYRYIWSEIGDKGNNFPWVITRGKTKKLLFCDGNAWKELSQINNWGQMKCKKVLNKCGVFYTNDVNWSRNPCDGLNDNNSGGSECTGCCQDLPLHSDVQASMDVLNNFVANASVNVWVNEEGKFNVARLGTDIASGAVLGTVGGLVSNVIIKKKQLEKGMSGYYCTVGSEPVADYGDEFIIDFPQ